MNIENILSLIGADQLSPEIKAEVVELIELLASDPHFLPAFEKLITLLGVGHLDVPTQDTIKENLLCVINSAHKELLQSLGFSKLNEVKQIRRRSFEKRLIDKLYCSKEKPLVEKKSDPDIEKSVVQNVGRKANYTWDRGFGSDPMRESKGKIDPKNYRWSKDNNFSPLSGKVYKTGNRGK